MKCEQKFLICKHCGNLVGMLNDSGVKIMCCGEPMQVIEPNTSDGAQEKHLPVVNIDGDVVTVEIGSAPHPMTEEHYIGWVYLQTDRGGQRKCLCSACEPKVKFVLADGDAPVAAYAYCNLHGLWKTKL